MKSALPKRRLPYRYALALLPAFILPQWAQAADTTPFVVDYSKSPFSLDPTLVCDITDIGFIQSLYVTLLKHGSKPIPGAPAGVVATQEDPSKLEGYLAQSWTVSPDGKTVTFKIRPGTKFANGDPVDAKAVAASLNRGLKSGNCGTYFVEAGQFGNTQSITATDDDTVVFTLKKPEPLVLQALTVPATSIVDVAAITASGDKDYLSTHAAGSGPYVLEDYEPGVKAVFEANPTFFGTPAREKEVLVNIVGDNSTLLLQARNGKADVTLGLSITAVASLAGDRNLSIVKVPTSRVELLALPNKMPPFDNVKFREGLSYAVPYEAILRNVAHGFGQVYYGPFAPALTGYNPAYGAPRRFDLAKAKALIKQSGAKLPVAVDMDIVEGQNDQEQMATIVQGAWAQVGVNVTIKKLPEAAYQQAVSAKTKQETIIRLDGPSVPDPAWLLDYDLRAASVFNTSNYENAKSEALLDEAHTIADPHQRQIRWDKIAAMWIADSPRIPIYAEEYAAVLSKKVKYWTFNINGPFDLAAWGR